MGRLGRGAFDRAVAGLRRAAHLAAALSFFRAASPYYLPAPFASSSLILSPSISFFNMPPQIPSATANLSVVCIRPTAGPSCVCRRRLSSIGHFPELLARDESEFARQLGRFRLERISKAVERFRACGDYPLSGSGVPSRRESCRSIAGIECMNPQGGSRATPPGAEGAAGAPTEGWNISARSAAASSTPWSGCRTTSWRRSPAGRCAPPGSSCSRARDPLAGSIPSGMACSWKEALTTRAGSSTSPRSICRNELLLLPEGDRILPGAQAPDERLARNMLDRAHSGFSLHYDDEPYAGRLLQDTRSARPVQRAPSRLPKGPARRRRRHGHRHLSRARGTPGPAGRGRQPFRRNGESPRLRAERMVPSAPPGLPRSRRVEA